MTDSSGTLVASVTDGDIRRALLSGSSLDSPARSAFHVEVVALRDGSDRVSGLPIGSARSFRDYPVLDDSGKLVCVETQRPADRSSQRENTVVIMAGGKGLRLRPLTKNIPKPLLFVGGKPILQRIIEKLRDEGFSDIVISINYLGEQIQDFFGDGSELKVSIRYVNEATPLGTAGGLSLLEQPFVAPIVVMNGDLVLSASVGKMVDFHTQENAQITVGAKLVETNVPFGVIVTEGQKITAIHEKPTRRDLINAGIYVVNSQALETIKPGRPADMPDVISDHIQGGRVLAFPIHEDWVDLGHPDDLAQARADAW